MSGFRVNAVLLPDGSEPAELFVDATGLVAGTRVIDAETLPGEFVLPGLVDAHTHVTVDFTGLGAQGERLVRANLEGHLAAGELLVRDAGAMPGVPVEDMARLPRVIKSGMILAPDGPYASFMRTPRTQSITRRMSPWS